MRVFCSLALLVGLSTVADAGTYGCPGKECKKSASSYCSSYMKVPKTTTTIYKGRTVTSSFSTTRTKGTKTITVAPTTIKVTETSTSTVTRKTVIETDTTSTVTVKPTCSAPSLLPELRRRSYPPSYSVPKPKCFSAYKGMKAISSACKCVDVKPSATTVFSTFTTTKKVTSTITVNKSTVTETPTVTEKTITTAPPTTTTQTETKVTKSEVTTVTSGRPVLPTGAFNIVLGNPQQATPPSPDNIGAVEGLRAVVGGGDDTVSPIDFISPAELDPTTFSLTDNGNLFSEGQTLQAFISNTQGNNPQQLSFPGFDSDPAAAFPEGSSAVFCELIDNETDDFTCEISCGSSPGEQPQLPESRSRRQKRGIIVDPGDDEEEEEPEPIPSFVVNPLACGLGNSYFLGDGGDFESGVGSCIQISAFVVPAAAAAAAGSQ